MYIRTYMWYGLIKLQRLMAIINYASQVAKGHMRGRGTTKTSSGGVGHLPVNPQLYAEVCEHSF